ncbi:hypothetical protein GW796_06055 [archaeon]|nr:hypothetical protein [archaeon]
MDALSKKNNEREQSKKDKNKPVEPPKQTEEVSVEKTKVKTEKPVSPKKQPVTTKTAKRKLSDTVIKDLVSNMSLPPKVTSKKPSIKKPAVKKVNVEENKK